MRVAIHGLSLKTEFLPILGGLFEKLQSLGISICLTPILDQQLRLLSPLTPAYQILQRPEDFDGLDFFLSIGGDGTLLDESRILLSLTSSKKLFHGVNFALNEFTIHKKDTSSMITVHTYIDGKYLNSYWADGLIVATPTGSTGYSLSCGGPLITPGAKNFVITPVSPHNLNVRPIIVSDEAEISFEIEGRTDKFMISLDSRSTSIASEVKLSVKKEAFSAKLVKLPSYHFFDTLRQKLYWGLDLRN